MMVIHEAEGEIHIGTDSLNTLLFPSDRASQLQKSSDKAGLKETVPKHFSQLSVFLMIPLNYR